MVGKSGDPWARLHYRYTGRAEGLRCMRRHRPVVMQCTDSVVVPCAAPRIIIN